MSNYLTLQIHKYNDLSMIFLYVPRDKSHDGIGKTSKYTPDIHESYKFVPSLIDKIQKTRDTKALQRAINSYLYLVAAAPSLYSRCSTVLLLRRYKGKEDLSFIGALPSQRGAKKTVTYEAARDPANTAKFISQPGSIAA